MEGGWGFGKLRRARAGDDAAGARSRRESGSMLARDPAIRHRALLVRQGRCHPAKLRNLAAIRHA